MGNADIQWLYVGTEQNVTDTLEHIGQADSCHEQDDRFLFDQILQDKSLDQPGQDDHHANSQQDGHPYRKSETEPSVDPSTRGHKIIQGQGREQAHDPLGKVENTGCLEYEYEAKRYQRVHHTGHQTTDYGFDEKANFRMHGASAL